MKQKNQFKIPEYIWCNNCQKNLPTNAPDMRFYPDESTPENEIHNENNPNKPMFSVMCPYCGHFYMNKLKK